MYMNKNVVVKDFITGSKMTKLKETSKSRVYPHDNMWKDFKCCRTTADQSFNNIRHMKQGE